MSKQEIQIVFPFGAFGGFDGEDQLDTVLRIIAVGFDFENDWSEKYGVDYENETFLMKRFCWCEKEGECPWCTGCNCTKQIKCDYHTGRGIFERFAPWDIDTKGDGPRDYNPPNFWHKPSDFRLTWYKYIGRSVSFNHLPPTDLLESVFASHPRQMTIEQAVEKLKKQQVETEKSMEMMFRDLF